MSDKKAEVMPISNMSDLYLLLLHWHDRNIKQAHHLSKIPKGTELELHFSKDEDSEPIKVKLEGDTYSGFIAGIVSTMAIFEELPFKAVEVEEEDLAEEPVSPAAETVH